MLLNRSFHLLSVRLSMIPSSRNRQIEVAIAALTLPVLFTPVSEAQMSEIISEIIKARESEGKEYVRAMNKAQLACYAENGGFKSSFSNLGLGLKPETANYKYSISTGNKAVFNYGVSKQANLKSFVGGVFIVGNTFNYQTILCQTNAASTTKPANPTNKNGVLACGANTAQVTR